MKISFVYKVDELYWNDGLKKAIDVISERHDVKRHNGEYTNYFADWVLVWGSLTSWQSQLAVQLPYKKAICIGGLPLNHPDIHKYDVVFVETEWHRKELKKIGINSTVAFGTNNDLFFNRNLERPIDRIYPAAFAKWKRHELFLQKEGLKLAVGEMQRVETECYEMCQADPMCITLPMVTPEVLSHLYNQSKTVSITSDTWGGGERAILEGLACGCKIEIEPDNEKLLTLYEDVKGGVPGYLEYANKILEGLI